MVIFTAMRGNPISMLIHDISFARLENGRKTVCLSEMNGDSGEGDSAQSIPIGFKTHWCLSPPDG